MNINDNQTNETLAQLVENLAQELKLYILLEETIRNKQQSIVQGNVNEMRELVEREQTLLLEAQGISEQRQLSVNAVAENIDTLPANPALKDIIPRVPEVVSIKLAGIRQDLRAVLQRIARLNQENGFLLSASLEHVRSMVHLFLRFDPNPQNVYDVNGAIAQQEVDHNVLDCQI